MRSFLFNVLLLVTGVEVGSTSFDFKFVVAVMPLRRLAARQAFIYIYRSPYQFVQFRDWPPRSRHIQVGVMLMLSDVEVRLITPIGSR